MRAPRPGAGRTLVHAKATQKEPEVEVHWVLAGRRALQTLNPGPPPFIPESISQILRSCPPHPTCTQLIATQRVAQWPCWGKTCLPVWSQMAEPLQGRAPPSPILGCSRAPRGREATDTDNHSPCKRSRSASGAEHTWKSCMHPNGRGGVQQIESVPPPSPDIAGGRDLNN